MADVEIIFADGPGAVNYNGQIKRRIGLRIDGEDKDIVMVRLDSDQARRQQAKRWAEAFDLDKDDLEGKLRRAAVVATEDSQRVRKQSDVRGAESPPVPPCTLDEVRPVFKKWLQNTDPDLLDVVFGAVLAHRLDGDPVWLFIVGAPGDGKTECLRALSQHPDIYTLSTLTPGALISGYITDGPDPSLLPKIDGKILVVKDFTAVLEMPNEARSEVLGILRDAYDGEACKVFGTGETKRYQSRFGLVAAVTPVIDSYWGVSAQLGERFLRFRLPPMGRKAKVRRALSNSNNERGMRIELSEAALGVLSQTPEPPEIPAGIEERLIALADFVALCRSEVSRDRQNVIKYIPAPEVGTRVGKALKKLCMGIAMARGLAGVGDDVYRIVARIATDTMPSMRARFIEVLWRLRVNYEPTATIADKAEVPTDTAKVWLDDLRLLGIVRREGGPRPGYTWNLRDDFQDTIEQAGLWTETAWGGTPSDFAPLREKQGANDGGAESPPRPHMHRRRCFRGRQGRFPSPRGPPSRRNSNMHRSRGM